MKQLRNANALVTGASRGIGPYIARLLAAEAVNVVLSARSLDQLEDVARSLEPHGVRTAVIPADLSEVLDRTALAERAQNALGGIDILVNNAGIESQGAFLEITEETIDQTVTVNFTAATHLARLLLPQMIERGHGHIVNISSASGKRGVPYDAIYSGTKAALIEWSNALRAELRDVGVGVSVISPGYVTETGMFAKFRMNPPMVLGSSTPDQVARAAVRAIKRNHPDIIVNSRPIRPLLALGELFPRWADWMMRVLGINQFQRRKVERWREKDSTPDRTR